MFPGFHGSTFPFSLSKALKPEGSSQFSAVYFFSCVLNDQIFCQKSRCRFVNSKAFLKALPPGSVVSKKVLGSEDKSCSTSHLLSCLCVWILHSHTVCFCCFYGNTSPAFFMKTRFGWWTNRTLWELIIITWNDQVHSITYSSLFISHLQYFGRTD